MTRRVAIAALAVLLLAAPVQAAEDPAVVVGAITTQVTAAVQAAQDAETDGSIWSAPYEAIADLDAVLDDGIATVEGLTVPDCLTLWLDTVTNGLRLLSESVQAVARAAGYPDDTARTVFSVTGPIGYSLLTQTAPVLLATADCPQDEGVA